MFQSIRISAEEAGLTNFDTRVMNAEKLELESDFFDAVIERRSSAAETISVYKGS